MSNVDTNVDNVLRKFEASDSENSDDDEVADTTGGITHKKYKLGLSKTQDYEFRTAFKMVSNGKDSLPINQMYELFQALGYTFQDTDIEEMLKSCLQDINGNYPLDSVLDAFDIWLKKQISIESLGAVFSMLHEQGRLQRNISEKPRDSYYKNKITPAQLLTILKDILPNEKAHELTDEDGKSLADEICCTSDRNVNFDDFVNLFIS